MREKKKIILEKIDVLLCKKKSEILEELPSVHEVNDGVIIRFFTEWDNCEDNSEIKFKKVENLDNPEEVVVFMYLPQGAFFDLKKRDYISTITCLNGKMEIDFGDNIRVIETNTKICVETDIFQGKALENTYIVTTNKP